MTINLVPRDIFVRHEHEWQAVRDAAERRIDVGKREKPTVAAGAEAARPANSPSAAQGC
ncbi:hypothetical protein [Rhizobium sp. GCM10022189]|jgi:hypothetical protein|uniref:hypothetical protein n=1 Tax=Rhizobium sp. GCM10022189 TaxID=3252654 RepID=UPI00360B59AE